MLICFESFKNWRILSANPTGTYLKSEFAAQTLEFDHLCRELVFTVFARHENNVYATTRIIHGGKPPKDAARLLPWNTPPPEN